AMRMCVMDSEVHGRPSDELPLRGSRSCMPELAGNGCGYGLEVVEHGCLPSAGGADGHHERPRFEHCAAGQLDALHPAIGDEGCERTPNGIAIAEASLEIGLRHARLLEDGEPHE